MGEAAASLSGGILSHLEKLEASAHKVALKKRELRQHEENVNRMKVRIQELRCRRDELRTKLKVCHSRVVGIKDKTKSDSLTSQATETSQQALLEWKIENAKGLLKVFRLTGLSGKLTKQGVCLYISTAFEGNYLDSYYLDLHMQQPIRIQRHSVPAFIPLEQIAHKHLQTDTKRFLSVLSNHLNAYAGRKFQADQLQERFAAFLEGRLQGNSLYNLLEFNYGVSGEGKTFPFTAKLTYGDPMSALPTEVTVTCKEFPSDTRYKTASKVQMTARP
ncbi:centromere protein O isoform X2 [Rhineura floridana]|uniref:centromere protein O isoform X2 n=1 Tax=Rhineura floridana TaxID=261503 RepID=UPI002AC7FE4E|nr:centromere protein O isoform X2 [Rhineura floridana]